MPTRYAAFISYDHADLAVAERLHRSLEHYVIPKVLSDKMGFRGEAPRRLYPIFRDKDDLGSSPDLTESIREALEQSQYLIVVCSPESRESKWVNNEIRLFKQMGRSDRILAVIAAGTPNAAANGQDPAAECFPPALRFEVNEAGDLTDVPVEPLAADLRGGRDRDALLRVIAGLLDVGLDELIRRDQRDRRRRLILTSLSFLGVAAAALALLIGGVIFGAGYRYQDTVGQFAVGERLKTIKSPGRGFAARGLAMVSQHYGLFGSVNALDALTDGLGECKPGGMVLLAPPFAYWQPLVSDIRDPIDGQPIPCAVDVSLAQDGALRGYRVRDQMGAVIAEFQLLQPDLGALTVVQGPPIGLKTVTGAPINVTLVRSGGRITSVRFTGNSGLPAPMYGLATRVDYDYDGAGRLKQLSFKNADGRLATGPFDGRAGYRFTYDLKGRLTQVTSFDADGQTRWDARHTAPPRLAFVYPDPNTIRIDALGPRGSAPEPDNRGVAGTVLIGAGDEMTRQLRLGPDGKPIPASPGLCPKFDRLVNAKARTVTWRCFDGDGRAVDGGNGAHAMRFQFGPKAPGWIRREALGPDMRPTTVTGSAESARVRTFDKQGFQTSFAILGLDGRPAVLKPPFPYRQEIQTDAAGREVRQSWFGPDDKPMVNPALGFAVRTMAYATAGAGASVVCHYGPQGPMVNTYVGFACMREFETAVGSDVRHIQRYTGADGRLYLNPTTDFAEIDVTVGDDRRVKAKRYLGADGRLRAPEDEGYAEVLHMQDDHGQVVRSEFHDAQGRLVLNHICGYAALAQSYGPSGLVRIDLLGEDGEPRLVPELGFASLAADPGGEVWAALDANGAPLHNPLADRAAASMAGQYLIGRENSQLVAGNNDCLF